MKPPTVGVRPLVELLVGQADQQEGDGDAEDHATQDVEVALRIARLDRRQQSPDEVERHQADGDVDVEDPVPAVVLGQEAAHQRADHEGDAEDRTEEALVLAALLRREQVPDDGQCDREERAGADALDAAEDDELRHVLAETGEGRADEEDDDADHEDRLAPVKVRELAPEGHADRARQEEGGDRPRVVVVAGQLRDDGRQRRPDDGLVEGGQEDAQQDREEDLHLLALRQAERRVLGQGRDLGDAVDIGCVFDHAWTSLGES